MDTCRICENQNNNVVFVAREMMFGWREEFEYFKCSSCGCLQIRKKPDNLGKYYPPEYCSLVKTNNININPIRYFLRVQKAKLCLQKKRNFIERILTHLSKCEFLELLRHTNINFDSKILDVGTGVGKRLIKLRNYGFINLTGTDIFIDNEIEYNNGIKILNREISELDGEYDFIMLNHVFEHMPDPKLALEKLYNLLKAGSYLFINIPVIDSEAWKLYGVNWVQLDAPRHLFLHTTKSIEILAKKTSFVLVKVIYNSKASQFYGSEQYKLGIPQKDPRSYYINPKNSIFTKKQIKKFQKKAREFNKTNKGDAACFYLYKPNK